MSIMNSIHIVRVILSNKEELGIRVSKQLNSKIDRVNIRNSSNSLKRIKR